MIEAEMGSIIDSKVIHILRIYISETDFVYMYSEISQSST